MIKSTEYVTKDINSKELLHHVNSEKNLISIADQIPSEILNVSIKEFKLH